MQCTTQAGWFEVRDIATQADGTLSRLAVDFEHLRDGGTPVAGSYRLNSTIPIRP